MVAAAVDGGEFGVEHELDVVGAVGDAQVDPTELFGVGGAAPGFLEAEDFRRSRGSVALFPTRKPAW